MSTHAVRNASEADLEAVLDVERRAFGRDSEADLTRDLLADPTAEPRLSLLAFAEERPVGHILFTAVRIEGVTRPVAAALLAPLAVVPEAQRRGIGGQLIREGLRTLRATGIGMVFVLGHAGYYPRHGFAPAMVQGFDAPYPIPGKHADDWMVLALHDGIVGTLRGRVVCAEALMRPKFWRP